MRISKTLIKRAVLLGDSYSQWILFVSSVSATAWQDYWIFSLHNLFVAKDFLQQNWWYCFFRLFINMWHLVYMSNYCSRHGLEQREWSNDQVNGYVLFKQDNVNMYKISDIFQKHPVNNKSHYLWVFLTTGNSFYKSFKGIYFCH